MVWIKLSAVGRNLSHKASDFLTATRVAFLAAQNFSGKGQTKLVGFCSFQKGGEHRQATPSLNELARKLAEGQQLRAWQVHLLSTESVD